MSGVRRALRKAAQARTARKLKLTRNWYYRASGIDEASRKGRKWIEKNDAASFAFGALREKTSKTSKPEEYREFVNVYNNNFEALWQEMLKKRWANQTHRLYSGKTRVLQRFVNSLGGGPGRGRNNKKVMVAYGGAVFASGKRNERHVPVKRVRRMTRQTHSTAIIDEFNTSKMCPTCELPLQEVMARIRVRGEEPGQFRFKTIPAREHRRCNNQCPREGTSHKNRDVVGAQNILKCAKAGGRKDSGSDRRPACLRRTAVGEEPHPHMGEAHLLRPVEVEGDRLLPKIIRMRGRAQM